MENGLKKYLTENELGKIRGLKIGIAGCGGLGSNAVQNLVRLGFRNLLLVDFDIVEATNLNRQFYFYNQIGDIKCHALKYNLEMINPNLNITTKTTIITRKNIYEIFKDCDLVIEGFDKVQDKIIIIEELLNIIPLISASGLGEYWKVDSITTREINRNFTIVGDFISDVDNGISPLSPGVQIAAAKEAAAVLKFALGGQHVPNN